MFSVRVGLAIVLLIVVAAEEPSKTSCDKPGILTDGKSPQFQICSRDSDGGLSLKTLSCGDNSYFCPEEKRCISNESNDLKPSLRIGVSTRSSNSINSWCPKSFGNICSSCSSLTSCIDNRVVGVLNCGQNKTCDAYKNQCTNDTISECAVDYTFNCNSFGLFPDPYFCHRFHFCQNIGASPLTLGCSQPYDYKNDECSYIYQGYNYNKPCPMFPKCTQDLQVGSLPDNPRIFYVCLTNQKGELYRNLFRCPRGKQFINNQCRLNNSTKTN